jgi:hypothetical protein
MKNELTNLKLEKINLETCIRSFEENFPLLTGDDIIKLSFNFELDDLKIRGLVWKIYLDTLNYDDNKIDPADWIKSTRVFRNDYSKHKNKFSNRRKFTSDPLDIQNVTLYLFR